MNVADGSSEVGGEVLGAGVGGAAHRTFSHGLGDSLFLGAVESSLRHRSTKVDLSNALLDHAILARGFALFSVSVCRDLGLLGFGKAIPLHSIGLHRKFPPNKLSCTYRIWSSWAAVGEVAEVEAHSLTKPKVLTALGFRLRPLRRPHRAS